MIKIIKILPFIVSIITGVIIFTFASSVENDNYSSLLNNISASFLAIPLIYVFYQSVENYSRKKLNKEILEYCKIGIDGEILSISNQLHKIIYPLVDNSYDKNFMEIFNLDDVKIKNIIVNNNYVGFQIFKHWEISQNSLEKLLDSPLILKNFDDNIIKCVISILKHLYSLSRILEDKDLYIDTGEANKNYKVVKGTNINCENSKYPDRYLLLKPIDREHSVVVDFGDLYKYNLEKALNIYKINPEKVSQFVSIIYSLIKDFKEWNELTGNKFILAL